MKEKLTIANNFLGLIVHMSNLKSYKRLIGLSLIASFCDLCWTSVICCWPASTLQQKLRRAFQRRFLRWQNVAFKPLLTHPPNPLILLLRINQSNWLQSIKAPGLIALSIFVCNIENWEILYFFFQWDFCEFIAKKVPKAIFCRLWLQL